MAETQLGFCLALEPHNEQSAKVAQRGRARKLTLSPRLDLESRPWRGPSRPATSGLHTATHTHPWPAALHLGKLGVLVRSESLVKRSVRLSVDRGQLRCKIADGARKLFDS